MLVVALPMLTQTSAGATPPPSAPGLANAPGLKGLPQKASDRAHELGYALTPSTTEPYLACGLPTRGHASCLSIVIPPGVVHRPSPLGPLSEQGPRSASPGYEGSGEGGGFSPSDLRSAYKIAATGGAGQTVAIVDAYDDPNAEADLKTYRSHYGLSECTTANGCFKKVNQKGEEKNYPVGSVEWAQEISLDLDMVSAMCNECHILLVEATNAEFTNLTTAENESATLGATEISNSWGAHESSEDTSDDSFFNHPSIPITASSGDSGYGVEYPAASRYVISVGGTTLTKAEGTRGWEEKVWTGAGSGCSAYESKPGWQTDPSCTRRTVADVAAVADPKSPVSTYDSYSQEGWLLFGGTSVAAPILAGVEAHASKAVREEAAEAFYRHALYDVTTGSNGHCRGYLCNGEEGYDAPTGWGTPDGPLELTTGFHAITKRATSLSPTGATLNGYIDPEGKETTYQFEYGETTSYGLKAPASPAGVGSGVVWKGVSQSVAGLARETTYHYRLSATNSSGTVYGADRTFSTTVWTAQAAAQPSEAEKAKLQGVSCSSSSACTAVGAYHNLAAPLRNETLLAERWNGTEWNVQTTPNPSEGEERWSALYSVSCSSSSWCVAVGAYIGLEGGHRKYLTFAEQWNGTEWKLQSTPNPISEDATLWGVSCSSSTACTAVGRDIVSKKRHAFAERWNGTEWKFQSAPEPTGSEESTMLAVSCSSSSACTAVGEYYNSSAKRFEMLAEQWNGTEWKVQSTPEPSGGEESALYGVSCPSSTDCTAVGGYYNSSAKKGEMLAEQWNGTEWKLQSTPEPSGETSSSLMGVSCSSASVCTAAGDGKPEAVFGDHWDGAKWQMQSAPLANEAAESWWNDVSCTASQVCFVVGESSEGALVYRRETLPTAITEAASGVGAANATLNGTVNPQESDTHYHFEYGTTLSYGTSTTETDAGSGTAGVKGSREIRGLKGSTTYHFRIVATNGAGTIHGEDKTFTTFPAEWRLGGAALTEPLGASWKGKVTLSGSETVVGMECEDAAEGPVAPGNTGEVTKWSASKCVALKRCESGSASLEAVHLPWHTELVTVEGTTREVLTGTGHGEPGYKMLCKITGTTVEDLCTAPTLTTTTTNGTSGVTATFLAGEKLTCNEGKVAPVTLEGTQTITATKGGKLSADNATEAAKLTEAEWRLGGATLTESLGASWKGKVTLSGSETVVGMECEDAAEGPVAPGNTGEVTKWSASKCVALKRCESGSASLEAVHLPWHTELVTVEGTTREVLTGTGHGEPGYKMLCKITGTTVEDLCTAPTLTTTTTNGTSGVTATFLAGEKLTCNEGKVAPVTLEGTQTITATKGGKLEA